jgi:hypothetical protein
MTPKTTFNLLDQKIYEPCKNTNMDVSLSNQEDQTQSTIPKTKN